jgi:hypothetical protein
MNQQPKHFILFAPLLGLVMTSALAGCAPPDNSSASAVAAVDPVPEDNAGSERPSSGDDIAIGGTGWLSIGTDGAVLTTHLDADGTYRDYRNGEFLYVGSWERREDRRLCFVPRETNLYGACWELDDAGGSRGVNATNEAGRTIQLKRVAYRPPEVEAAEADPDSQTGA